MSGLPYPTYDADHHFYEPPEALMRYLPKEFKHAVSYVQVNGRTKLAIGGLISDYIPDPTFSHIAAPGKLVEWYMGKNAEGLSMRESMGKPIAPKNGWRTGEERLKELDEQGLNGALMFPTLVSAVEERMGQYNIPAMCAIMHSLNQWMLEEWTFNRQNRIFTAPVISLADIDWAVKELDWAIKNGAKTVLVRPAPVPGINGTRSPGFEEFDPFWARINESKIFVSMHASDSGYDRFVRMWVGGNEYKPFKPSAFSHILKPAARVIADTCAALICHGVFDRFPDVKIATIENGAAWVGELLRTMEKAKNIFPQEFKYDPVQRFKENVYVAPFYEDSLDGLRDLVGADQVLFGSDYPHPEGVASPLQFIDRLDAYTEEEQRKVMGGNLLGLLERSGSLQ
ncbi:MAG: amidohydrolase family protein [Pseudomonadota bacterium]|nr:amidohydrolase family protein [Pseudomonadota bacterium]